MASVKIVDLREPQTTSVSTTFPNQVKENYSNDDYVNTLRWIAAQWNTQLSTADDWRVPDNEVGLPLGFATRARVWAHYYFGEQKNIMYNQFTLNADGTRLAQNMFRGMDIFKFVNYVVEPLMNFTELIPRIITTETVSKDIVSKNRLLKDFGKFMIDQKNTAEYMNKKFGMYMQTGNGVKFGFDAEKSLQSIDYREDLAIMARNVGLDGYYRNYLNELFSTASINAVLTGLFDMKVSIVNGYPCVEVIPAYESIFPVSTVGDQHRNDQFGGRIRFLTVPEVAAYYKLEKTHLDELTSIAQSQGNSVIGLPTWATLNATGSSVNFKYWSLIDGIPRIACIEGQWASWTKEDADEGRQTLRQGALIGNRFLVDCEITKNQSKDWRNPLQTDLDYIRCQPMSVGGRNMGFPEMIYRYQNRIDALQTKLDYWVNRAKGTYIVIKEAYLDENTDAAKVMSFITDIGVVTTKGVDEDAGEVTKNKMIEEGAIEMPRDMINVINQISLYRQMMADILNIPDAARGMLQGYVPEKTLSYQQSQSSKGTRFFYKPLEEAMRRVMQKLVDKFKISTLSKEMVDYELILGDTGTDILRANEDFGLSKHSVYLKFEDIADEGFKQRAMERMMVYAQSGQSPYTESDFLAIETMDTKSEIENYFQYRDMQIKMEREAQRQEEMAAASQQSQAANNTQLAMTEVQAESGEAKQAEKIASDEAIAAAKIEADLIKNQKAN